LYGTAEERCNSKSWAKFRNYGVQNPKVIKGCLLQKVSPAIVELVMLQHEPCLATVNETFMRCPAAAMRGYAEVAKRNSCQSAIDGHVHLYSLPVTKREGRGESRWPSRVTLTSGRSLRQYWLLEAQSETRKALYRSTELRTPSTERAGQESKGTRTTSEGALPHIKGRHQLCLAFSLRLPCIHVPSPLSVIFGDLK
jgi:hypothetical protein